MTYGKIAATSLILSILAFLSCTKSVVSEGVNNNWLIPTDEIFEGGPGRDGIPALITPATASVSQTGYLSDGELVIGIKIGDQARAYPHQILDWHEIANDEINDVAFAITYCPLTGSAIAWDRTLNGTVSTFGVSGLLYNTNLIPYDRESESYWSQMKIQSVNGPLAGQTAGLYPIVETSWKTWREMYPDSRVVSRSTGYDRSYGFYPYGQYRSNDEILLFPIGNDDDRLPRKELVHGIIVDNVTRVYRFNSFPQEIEVINGNVNGLPVVVAGSKGKNLIVSFSRIPPDGTPLAFEAVQDSLPVIMRDDEGNNWDIFGEAVSGPRAGARLIPIRSFKSFWFAWAAFYPNAEIYGQ